MYRRILFVLMLFFASLSLSAQAFEGGISGGLNASWLSNISQKGYQLWSFHGGLFSQAKLSKHSDLRFELRYSKEGNHIIPKETGDYTILLDYVDLPISYIKYLPNDFLGIKSLDKAYLIGGLSVGYLIKAKEGFRNHEMEDPIHPFHSYDIASHVGIGCSLGKHIFSELRYSLSILPVRESVNEIIFVLGEQKNNVFSLNFYYRF